MIQQLNQLDLGVSREGLQTKTSLGNYTLMIYAAVPHVLCMGFFNSMVICGLGCSNTIWDSFFISTQAGHQLFLCPSVASFAANYILPLFWFVLLVHLLTNRAWEAKKVLDLGKTLISNN